MGLFRSNIITRVICRVLCFGELLERARKLIVFLLLGLKIFDRILLNLGFNGVSL
jgi:hypothetical protein